MSWKNLLDKSWTETMKQNWRVDRPSDEACEGKLNMKSLKK